MYDMKFEVILEAGRKEEEDEWEQKQRQPVPVVPVEKRRNSFNEIELGFSEEQAKMEAGRCLRCDLEK
jgi:hypothetical protein